MLTSSASPLNRTQFSSTSRVASTRGPLFQGSVENTSTLPPEASKVTLKPKVQYGRFENNLREGIRVSLVHVLPLAIAPISLAGLPGLMISVSLGLLAYVAGNIGRRIGRHVDPQRLNGVLKLFHRLHALFNPELSEKEKQNLVNLLKEAKTPEIRDKILQKFNERNHVDKINDVFSDFAASAKLPRIVSFIRNDRFRGWLLNSVKIGSETRTGRFVNTIINNNTLFKNQVFGKIAQSNSAGEAIGVGVRGAKDGYVDFMLMPKIGRGVSKFAENPFIPGFFKPVIQGTGVTLKNWFITKSAWDAAKAVRKMPGKFSGN